MVPPTERPAGERTQDLQAVEQRAFEALMYQRFQTLGVWNFRKNQNGNYAHRSMRLAWFAWQASGRQER